MGPTGSNGSSRGSEGENSILSQHVPPSRLLSPSSHRHVRKTTAPPESSFLTHNRHHYSPLQQRTLHLLIIAVQLVKLQSTSTLNTRLTTADQTPTDSSCSFLPFYNSKSSLSLSVVNQWRPRQQCSSSLNTTTTTTTAAAQLPRCLFLRHHLLPLLLP